MLVAAAALQAGALPSGELAGAPHLVFDWGGDDLASPAAQVDADAAE